MYRLVRAVWLLCGAIGIGYNLFRILPPLNNTPPSAVLFDCEVLYFTSARMQEGSTVFEVIASWNMRLVEFAETVCKDERVKVVVLKIPTLNIIHIRPCQMYESINKMRDAGKKVYVYVENELASHTMGGWAALFAADRVYVSPSFQSLMMLTPVLRASAVKKWYANLLMDVLPLSSKRTTSKDVPNQFREEKPSLERVRRVADFLERQIEVWSKMMLASADLSSVHVEQLVKQGVVPLEYCLDCGLVSVSSYEQLAKSIALHHGPIVAYADYIHTLPTDQANPPIVVLPINGQIAPRWASGRGVDTEWIESCVERIVHTPGIRVVVIDLSGPGGYGWLGKVLHQSLCRIKQSGKRLVVLCGEPYVASADYMIACAATPGDLLAVQGCLVGSIGVFHIRASATRQTQTAGVEEVVVWKGARNYQDPYGLSKAQIKVFQSDVDKFYEEFRQHVASARRLTVEQMDLVATGAVFSAIEAFEYGLVDQVVWGMHAALDHARRTINDPHAAVGYCTRSPTLLRSLFFLFVGTGKTGIEIAQALAQASKTLIVDEQYLIESKLPNVLGVSAGAAIS